MVKRTISFRIDEDMLSWIDANAKSLNMTRTGYFEFLFTQAKPLMEQINPLLDSILAKFVQDKKLEDKAKN